MGKTKKKYYVVWAGREPGVYDDWDDAREQIEGFPGARYKGFESPAAAAEAFRLGSDAKPGSLGSLLINARAKTKAVSRKSTRTHGRWTLPASATPERWNTSA